MYHCVVINKLFSVMDKSFETTFLWKKNYCRVCNSFGSTYTGGGYLITFCYLMIIHNAQASNTLKQ